MKTLFFGFVTILACCACNIVHASAISAQLGVITPYTGAYIDWAVKGVSFEYDNGPSGNGFITFHTYDSSGRQINYEGQQVYMPTSEQERLATGIIGRAAGEFSIASGGPCLGCTPSQQILTNVGIAYSLAWTTPRSVTLVISGAAAGTYGLVAANFESQDDGEFVPGTWALSFVNDNSVYPGQGAEYQNHLPTELAVVNIAPAPFNATQVTLDPASSADVRLPPATAHLYTMRCAGNQMGADDAACNSTELIWTNVVPGSQRGGIPRGTAKAMLWFDPPSATSGMDIYQQEADGNVVIGPADFHGQLYITPNSLQVHLLAEGPPGVAAVTDGIDGIALTFTRLPSTAVRDCYDYVSSSPCQ